MNDELINELKVLNTKIDIITKQINNLNEKVDNIIKVQMIHNDSLMFLMNHSNNDKIVSQLITVNAKLNDNDLRVSSIEDTLDDIHNKTDSLPEQFQTLFDSLSAIYYERGSNKNTNPYGGIIISEK